LKQNFAVKARKCFKKLAAKKCFNFFAAGFLYLQALLCEVNIKMDYKTIGERIKHIRKLENMNQTTLATLLGISQGTLSEIESGKSLPSLDVIIGMSDTFKLDLNWLINDSSDKSSVLKEDEYEIISYYRKLETLAQEEVLDFLKLKLKRYKRL
jgi:transcriptional regulator with XRE-family HTH domain